MLSIGAAVAVRFGILCLTFVAVLPIVLSTRLSQLMHDGQMHRLEQEVHTFDSAAVRMQEDLDEMGGFVNGISFWMRQELLNRAGGVLPIAVPTLGELVALQKAYFDGVFGAMSNLQHHLLSVELTAFIPTPAAPTSIVSFKLQNGGVGVDEPMTVEVSTGSLTTRTRWSPPDPLSPGAFDDWQPNNSSITVPSNRTALAARATLEGEAVPDDLLRTLVIDTRNVSNSKVALTLSTTDNIGVTTTVFIELPMSEMLEAAALRFGSFRWAAVVRLSPSPALGAVIAFLGSVADRQALQDCLRDATASNVSRCYPSSVSDVPSLKAQLLPVASPLAAYFAVAGRNSNMDQTFTTIAQDHTVIIARQLLVPRGPTLYLVVGTVIPDVLVAPLSVQLIVAAACLLILVAVFLAYLAKRHVVDELHDLQNAMEGVMALDFTDVGSERSKPQRFIELARMRSGFVQMSDAIQILTRFIPQEVVKDMLKTGSLQSREMVSKVITVMFVDINNFTQLTEAVNSDDLVTLAEMYFTMTTRVLTQHGCTIDKYIGDVVMGFWGAPLEFQRQGYSALSCALHVLSQGKRLAREFEAHGQTLWLRIGVARGQCAVGNIGSDERISYTALGDTVNLASRLQMLNSFYKTSLIVSSSVIEHARQTSFQAHPALANFSCADLFVTRRLGLVRVKGKNTSVAVFNVLGARKTAAFRMAALVAGSPKSPTEFDTSILVTTVNGLPPPTPPGGKQRLLRPPSRSADGMSESGRSKSSAESGTKGISRRRGGSSMGATTVSTEKAPLLAVAEEISVLRTSLVEDSAVEVSEQLSAAIDHFENMRFEEAVRIYEEVLGQRTEALSALGLDIPTLQRQVGGWQILVQHPPPREAFDPCENMTKK